MMNRWSDFFDYGVDMVNGWIDCLYHWLGIRRNIYIRQGDWDAFSNELAFWLVVATIFLMFLRSIWRFIKERHYPFWYRMFDYLGCFFIFVDSFFAVEIGEEIGLGKDIIMELILLSIGVGGVCCGMASKMLSAENSDPINSRKKDWKMLVWGGSYLAGFSILMLFDVF